MLRAKALDKGWFGTSQLGLAAVVRGKTYDDWARSFLADHTDAVVPHLGCGLDARVLYYDEMKYGNTLSEVL